MKRIKDGLIVYKMGLGAFVFFLRKKAVLRTIFPELDSLLKGKISVRLFIYINVLLKFSTRLRNINSDRI